MSKMTLEELRDRIVTICLLDLADEMICVNGQSTYLDGTIVACLDAAIAERDELRKSAHEQYLAALKLQAERDKLRERVGKLDALEAVGVDNWSGYESAMETLAEWRHGGE
jgi:uncharacterized coiled-coil DUF342 family protein